MKILNYKQREWIRRLYYSIKKVLCQHKKTNIELCQFSFIHDSSVIYYSYCLNCKHNLSEIKENEKL